MDEIITIVGSMIIMLSGGYYLVKYFIKSAKNNRKVLHFIIALVLFLQGIILLISEIFKK